MGEERLRGNGRKLGEAEPRRLVGNWGKNLLGTVLGGAGWALGRRNRAEKPGGMWREGKMWMLRDGGTREGGAARLCQSPSLSILPIPSAPPTSCATLRSWCCLGTLWASPRLP